MLRDEHLREFIERYKPGARHQRQATWSEDNLPEPDGRHCRRDHREPGGRAGEFPGGVVGVAVRKVITAVRMVGPALHGAHRPTSQRLRPYFMASARMPFSVGLGRMTLSATSGDGW